MINLSTHGETTLKRYMKTAMKAGVSYDQAINFLKGGYIPLPWALPFHAAARAADRTDGPLYILLGGARGPGKTHTTMAQVGLDDCQRYPGLKVLFLRKVQKAARESFEDIVQNIFTGIDLIYTASPPRIKFPNGSRIIMGGFNNESEIDNYLGIEYDLIAIEEASQLSENKIEMLKGSLRSSKPGWRTRIYLTTNPGGIGHKYIRSEFVIPYRQGKETLTRFYPSTYRDNPYLSPEYITYLENLKGPLGKAWRDGSFDVFEGQAFMEFDQDLHVIDPPTIPEHWPKWRAIDWGFANPWSCHWYTRDPDNGRVIVYREAYRAGLTVPQQCQIIKDLTPIGEKIGINMADPALWGRKTFEDTVITTADEYANHGLILARADNNRKQGKQKIHQLLAPMKDGRPGLLISSACEHMIEQLQNVIISKTDPEDIDTDQEDHAYDDLRYGLSNIRLASMQEPIKNTRSPIAELFG
jgi:PBSX family phage terminase large subunit